MQERNIQALATWPGKDLMIKWHTILTRYFAHAKQFASTCVFLIAALWAIGQPRQHFENPIIYDAQSGLNVGNISSVVVDKNGFLWIAGHRGLQRFDGNHFKDYLSNKSDSSSLGSTHISDLFYDESNDEIWISNWNEGGLSVLDLNTEKFRNYSIEEYSSRGLPDNVIFWTYKDVSGNVWSSISKKGLSKYLPAVDSFESVTFKNFPSNEAIDLKSVNKIQCSTADKLNDSILWLGSNEGLLRFNMLTYNYQHFPFIEIEQNGFSIRSLFYSSPTQLFVGTWGRGMYTFNTQTKRFIKCNLEGHATFGYPSNNIKSISSINQNNLLLTSRAGLAIYDIAKNKVTKSLKNKVGEKRIYGAQFKDRSDRLYAWSNNLLCVYDPIRQQMQPFNFDAGNPNTEFRVFRTLLSDDNTLYIAASGTSGLINLNLESGKHEIYSPTSTYYKKGDVFFGRDVIATNAGKILVLTSNMIYELNQKTKQLIPWTFQSKLKGRRFRRMIKDTNGNIWIGSHNSGVNKIDILNNKVYHYYEELQTTELSSPGSIWDLQEDGQGNIWMRCDDYSVYDIKRDTFYNFPFFFHNENTSMHIEDLGIDKDGNVWIASHKHSIGITDANHPERGIVEYFDSSNGLQTKKPSRFFLDHNDNVWITSHGLEKVSPNRSTSDFYSSAYFLNEYFKTATQMNDGQIVLAYNTGVGLFHPDSIQTDETLPKPYVRSFKVFDKELKTALPLYQTQEIELKPDQNFFSFEVSALDPTPISNISFLYKLEGVDQKYIDPKGRDYIAYTDVGPGDYTFKLKASNAQGRWNNYEYKLDIHIATPWYKTIWAYAMIWMASMSIIYYLYQFHLSRKIAHEEAKRLKELDVFKSRFYTNITHEFRTPLTVISGMADQLKEQPTASPEKKINLIKKNSNELLQLMNQMLDLSKLQTGMLTSNIQQDEIIGYVKHLVESHESLASLKSIGLHFETDESKLMMDYDANMIQQVLTNLISNAIKFTSENGKILVTAQTITIKNRPCLQLSLKDNGIGISANELPYIFDRFHQANTSAKNQGSGIGLSLVQELIKLMGGAIKVKSAENIGTTFTIILPIKQDAPLGRLKDEREKENAHLMTPTLLDSENNKNEFPILLIIEDNEDVVYYIKTCLATKYAIHTSSNGVAGIQKALDLIPDIIISDVMMPYKDGFEVCATLKDDERTSHIPIILLTAKATSEDKLMGLSHGADAYLTKPFDKAELFIRMEKLVQIRANLHKKYSGTLSARVIETKVIKTKEDLFLEKTEQIILENLEDDTFTHEVLARALTLSRSQLHRKIKALSGNSTGIYIRLVRLSRAKELLQSDDLTISEIAYRVGFSSPVYFSQTFKKTFGVSPSESRQ